MDDPEVPQSDAGRTKDCTSEAVSLDIDIEATDPQNGNTTKPDPPLAEKFQGVHNGQRGAICSSSRHRKRDSL